MHEQESCRHPDWLGSSRFASTPSRTMYSDSAYAPFGEPYAQAGTSDLSFTGLNQDTVGGLYDADAREYSIQGRWPPPDPAGISSMHLTDPQTLNRYAYVRNNPLGYVDPSGLDLWDFFGGGGWGGGIWGGGIWDEHLPWDWPIDWQTLIFGPPRIEDFIIKDTWGYSDAELQQFDQYNLERANCVAQSLNTQYPGAGFEPVKDKYGAYGPTKGGHENPDLVANGVPTPLANEISASIKNNSSSQHCGDPTSIWCFGPGTRVGDSLHIPSGEAEPKPDLKNPNISAARVTAHNDRFNPNNDLASALGHVFVDVLWGNIVQFFGGDIDRRCATPY